MWGAVIGCAVLTLIGLVALWPRGDAPGAGTDLGLQTQPDKATVRTVRIDQCAQDSPEGGTCQFVAVEVDSGEHAGTRAVLQFSTGAGNPKFSSGDAILVETFADVNGEIRVSFFDFQRHFPLLVLGVLFVAAVLLLGRLRGLGALGGLAASLAVLVVFVLPSLLRGNDAVTVALIGSSIIAFLALYLAHGVNVMTSIALLGTFASLALIGVLAALFSSAAHLTGLADEYAMVLPALGLDVNLKGIVLAGIVIGSLGVLDDVTVTQVSAVSELHHAQPDATAGQLYPQALNIGRDHIASTVNTLFLAYAGAALPLMLLFTQTHQPVSTVVTGELVATEVIRSLVGSIGLVASVPITTWMAARLLARPDAVATPPAARVERIDSAG